MKAQIYTALEFSDESNGVREYTTYHIAAVTNAEAIQALYDDGVNSKLLFLANRDAHDHISSVEILSKKPVSKVAEADFQRWVRTAILPYWEYSGHFEPAAWVVVPYITR